jgi:hypothetical protein
MGSLEVVIASRPHVTFSIELPIIVTFHVELPIAIKRLGASTLAPSISSVEATLTHVDRRRTSRKYMMEREYANLAEVVLTIRVRIRNPLELDGFSTCKSHIHMSERVGDGLIFLLRTPFSTDYPSVFFSHNSSTDRAMRKQTTIESNPVEDNRITPTVSCGWRRKNKQKKKRGRSKPKKAPHSPEAPRKRPARSSRGVVVRGEPAAAVIVNSFPTTNPSLTPQIRLNLAPRLNHGRRCTGRPLRRHREKCRGFAVRDQLPSLYPGNHSLPRYYYRSNIT